MSGLAGILAGATLGAPPAPPPPAQTYDQVVAGHPTAAANLISWLKLADNTDTQALLANGTVTGATFDGTKVPDTSAGNSASFDGVDDNIQFTDNDSLELAAGTIIVFVQPAVGSLASQRGIWERIRTGTNTEGFGIHWWGPTNELVFEILTGGVDQQCRAGNALSEGTPACIIATWGETADVGAEMKLRVNEQVVATHAYTGGVPAQTQNWVVGARGPSGTLAHFWSGLISHIQIYNRVLTAQEIADLCPYDPPATLAAITSRNPDVYYPLSSTTGDLDQGSVGLTMTTTGTVASKSSDGWGLGGTSYLTVPHNAAFEGDTGAADRWVNSEVGVVGEFIVNSLAARQYLMAKASGPPGARLDSSWWTWVEPDGSLWLRVERNERVAELGTQPGLITTGVRFHVGLLFGWDGLRLVWDGRLGNDGNSNTLDWYGWDHRVRGNVAVCDGYRMVCNHPFRLGTNGDTGSPTMSDITVRHVAIFAAGETIINPAGRLTPPLDLAGIQAISGKTGPALPSQYYDGSEVNVALADAGSVKRGKIEGATAGQTVVLEDGGTHTLDAGDLTIPSGVRIKGGGKATTTLRLLTGDEIRAGRSGTWLSLGAGTGDLPPGTMVWSGSGLTGSLQAGDMLQLVANVSQHDDGFGEGAGSPSDTLRRRSEVILIQDVSGGDIIFAHPVLLGYTAAERASDGGVWRIRPSHRNISFEDMTVELQGPGTSSTGNLAWFAGGRFELIPNLRFKRVHWHQVNQSDDDRGMVLDACCNVDFGESDLTNNASDVSTSDFTHPYVLQARGSRTVSVHTGAIFGRGWASYVDRTFNNNGSSAGGGGGPTLQLAPVDVDQVNTTHEKVELDNYIEVSGGHDAYIRRDIRTRGTNGGWYAGDSKWIEVTGLVTQALMIYPAQNRSRKWYAHYCQINAGGGGNNLYRSANTIDAYASHVLHGQSSIASQTNYTNATFSNCSSPFPTSS